jgi:FKBP-type peptidyl-prolyl cis-trans isomerase
MMRSILFSLIAVTILFSCNKIDYKKTSSGLLYKIYPGKGKDSLAQLGNVVKFHFTRKLNDSVLHTSYGKMASYYPITPDIKNSYSPLEVLSLMRNGDSAVTVELLDTLLNRKVPGLPPMAKRGDRITTTIKIIEVFRTDSLARKDFTAADEIERPKREKEMRDLGMKEVKDYLAAKNIKAEETGTGTFVTISEQGTGEQILLGKYVQIKYTGRALNTEKEFQSSVYAFQLGTDPVVQGWVEGLLLFKKGGKGTIYIPGFLAYGQRPGPGGTPFEALIFDIEVLDVSDKPIAQELPKK